MLVGEFSEKKDIQNLWILVNMTYYVSLIGLIYSDAIK